LGNGSFVWTTRISGGTVGSAPVIAPTRNSGGTFALKYQDASSSQPTSSTAAVSTTGTTAPNGLAQRRIELTPLVPRPSPLCLLPQVAPHLSDQLEEA